MEKRAVILDTDYSNVTSLSLFYQQDSISYSTPLLSDPQEALDQQSELVS